MNGTNREELSRKLSPGWLLSSAFPQLEPKPDLLLLLLLQVYPEPRTENECLSNIREFLRACGATLRLEVRKRDGRRLHVYLWSVGGGREWGVAEDHRRGKISAKE